MTKLMAMLAVFAVITGNHLAFYWFGFGLWPKSWVAVIGFGIMGTVLSRYLFERVLKEQA